MPIMILENETSKSVRFLGNSNLFEDDINVQVNTTYP